MLYAFPEFWDLHIRGQSLFPPAESEPQLSWSEKCRRLRQPEQCQLDIRLAGLLLDLKEYIDTSNL